ncbi:MAG: IclR family transcriptional regulator [Deltaproteobacteria bacterium]|nr:IclR family transcriptional regulator [Deltaproteobacteria bacterium]
MKNEIPNLGKACQALKAIAEAPHGLTMGEVESIVAASQTTTFRLLNTLCGEGFLEKRDRNYHIGPALIQLGLAALGRVNLRTVAGPVLRTLAARTGETAHVAIPAGNASLILDVCESDSPVRAASRAGALADLHCSSTGKVFLAFREGEENAEASVAPLQKRTARTMTDWRALIAELARVRDQGFAIDDGEYYEGVRCLAAPVRNATGQVVGAIGITAAASSFTPSRDTEVAREVLAAAEQITWALSGKSIAVA